MNRESGTICGTDTETDGGCSSYGEISLHHEEVNAHVRRRLLRRVYALGGGLPHHLRVVLPAGAFLSVLSR